MNKRKRKKERKYLLLDRSALRLLNPEQREILDSKHTILYPPILFAENAQHGLDKPSDLFNFKNTVDVFHWGQCAKKDLLEGVPSGHYNIGTKISTTLIYEYPEADRKDLEEEAKGIVRKMEAEEETFKRHISLLRRRPLKFSELAMNHEDIPDDELLRKYNQAVRQSGQNPAPSESAALIGGGRKSVSKIRKMLDDYRDDYEMLFRIDTLEKAYRWVDKVIYKDTKSILDFLCEGKGAVIPLSAEEQAEIFNRFRREGEPHINEFAPYTRVATQLYVIIILYLVENKENSSPQGALRDFEYLYYTIHTNVTFISSDKWHKRCIEEIPLLKSVRKNFKFLPHINKDEEEHKQVLNSIGIKT